MIAAAHNVHLMTILKFSLILITINLLVGLISKNYFQSIF